MNKRISVLILSILLLSYLPLMEYETKIDDQQENTFFQEYQRNEISPNPNSIQNQSKV